MVEIYNHSIDLPTGVNISDMLGAYGDLLSSLQIENTLPIGGMLLQHPIPEIKKQILDDYMRFYYFAESLVDKYQHVKCVGSTNHIQLILIFYCS